MKELLKSLQSKVSRLKEKYQILKEEITFKQKESNQIQQEIKKLELKIENFNNSKDTIVSEHAILRYLERVKGLDIKAIEKEILSEEVLNLINTLGPNGSYPNNNFKVRLKNNIVTTITT